MKNSILILVIVLIGLSGCKEGSTDQKQISSQPDDSNLTIDKEYIEAAISELSFSKVRNKIYAINNIPVENVSLYFTQFDFGDYYLETYNQKFHFYNTQAQPELYRETNAVGNFQTTGWDKSNYSIQTQTIDGLQVDSATATVYSTVDKNGNGSEIFNENFEFVLIDGLIFKKSIYVGAEVWVLYNLFDSRLESYPSVMNIIGLNRTWMQD
jgi:hypothetical protein